MNVNKESEMIQEQQEKKQAQSEVVIGLLTNRGICRMPGLTMRKSGKQERRSRRIPTTIL